MPKARLRSPSGSFSTFTACRQVAARNTDDCLSQFVGANPEKLASPIRSARLLTRRTVSVERPPLPAPPYEGGCLCGAIRYCLSARPLGLNACHCNDCKKLSGATNLLMILAAREAFEQRGGEVARHRKRADSGREIDIVRCAACGVRLWHEPLSSPHLVFVAVGTLDDSRWAIPASHIWTEKAVPGVTFEHDAITVEGQPDRQTLLDAFAKIYLDR
jgi:hypothetical protein